MNTLFFTAAGASFDSVVLMGKLPAWICGWSRNALLTEAARAFAQLVFDDVGGLASDSDIVALADLIDEIGVEPFSALSAFDVNIQMLVDDYKSGDLDFASFERHLAAGAIDPVYLTAPRSPSRQELDCEGPGYFGVDFSSKGKRPLFCEQARKSLTAKTQCKCADDNEQPADRDNLDRWLVRTR
jgi:hypothetical protein